eukprot:s4192_g1.t6
MSRASTLQEKFRIQLTGSARVRHLTLHSLNSSSQKGCRASRSFVGSLAQCQGMGMHGIAAADLSKSAIFNPADCLRIRWQVSVGETTFAKFSAELLRKEGLWQGLWRPGLPFNMCAVAVSQGLRMGLYPTARDALQTLLPSDGQKSSAAMIGAGLMSGSFAYFTGAPLWLVKTRMQAAVQFAADGASTAVHIYPVHLCDYWRGCSPLIFRGALLTAGQMLGYDGTKTAGRQLGYKDGPLLHVAAATSASCCSVTGLGNLVWRTRMQKSVRVCARTQPSIVLEVLTMLS